MTYESLGEKPLDYFPCRYGNSKLLFRGPRRRLEDDFVAFIGGIETYGKFVETPFPTLVEHETGLKALNLGCANAGIDAFLTDKSLLELCGRSNATVIQVMGAQNMSNRFYAVHPRRNDRFLRASSMLTALYPEVDFMEFHFTRHMLSTLAAANPESFSLVEQELKSAWEARMRTLVEQIGGKVILLWLADHAPGHGQGVGAHDPEPLFVDRRMVDNLADHVSEVIEIVADPAEKSAGQSELVYAQMEQPAAEEMLGPIVHRRTAEALASTLHMLDLT